MLEKIRKMWVAFLSGLKLAKQELKGTPADPKSQKYTDIEHINWLAIAVEKIKNLACTEATFNVESDSRLTDELKALGKDLEELRFEITEEMLAEGDFYVFPSTDGQGNIYHSLLETSKVRITEIENDQIKSAYAVIDYYQPEQSTAFFLQRHHYLDERGTLTISYQAVNENGERVNVDRWSDLTDSVYTYYGANHIGFGRYKSPKSSRGLSTVYGVPLNFGCSDIEKRLSETIDQIHDEFENARSVVFTDPRNVEEGDDAHSRRVFKLVKNIIPVRRFSGDNTSQIDIYSPAIRGSEHWDKLDKELEKYEKQIGVSKGIFTENAVTGNATATEVRRANSDTIALIDAVHAAIDKGNEMTLEADGIYLGIRRDLWSYSSDWYDPFENPAEQWQRLKDGHSAGAVETADLTRWLFPNLTDDQVVEKLQNIQNEHSQSADAAIELALNKF